MNELNCFNSKNYHEVEIKGRLPLYDCLIGKDQNNKLQSVTKGNSCRTI